VAAADWDELMQEDENGVLDTAMRHAVRDALRRHKLLGESIVVWQGGKVVELKPDQF